MLNAWEKMFFDGQLHVCMNSGPKRPDTALFLSVVAVCLNLRLFFKKDDKMHSTDSFFFFNSVLRPL